MSVRFQRRSFPPADPPVDSAVLAEQKARFQASLVDQVEVAIVASDRDGVVTNWNAAAERLYGWTAAQALGARLTSLIVPAGDIARARDIRIHVEETGRWEGERQLRRKDGSTFLAFASDTVIRDEQGRPAGLVGVSVDATARNVDHGRLAHAERFLAVVMDNMAEGLFTVDGEGRLTYMNAVAERLLGWPAAEIHGRTMHKFMHHSRQDGTPRSAEDSVIAASWAGGRAARVEEDVFVRHDGTLLPVTFTASPLDAAGVVGGAVVVFSDISARQVARLKLLREVDELAWLGHIEDALHENGFVLFAQPIVDLADGRPVSHELLIRMCLEGRTVEPAEFLPIAERHGRIGDIDRWVIGEAARIAASGLTVQVNVSATSFAELDLPRLFAEALNAAGADPADVVVELTETALMNTDAAEEVVTHLNELGLQLSLDDFGTGYGAFTYLKRLPVSQLKIDREFIGDLAVDPASRHVVEAVIALARGFGQKTVAEGVEDQATLDLLKDLGVDYAQGSHTGVPAPAELLAA